MSIANPTAANETLAAFQAGQRASQADHAAVQATRDHLETAPEPVPDDGAPATAAEADPQPGFAMTEARRVGAVSLPVDSEGSVRFGKPSGRASAELLGPIQEMEEGGGDLTELTAYVWQTLGAWCLDDERDADHWADEHGLMDTITLCRNLALGGNAPTT